MEHSQIPRVYLTLRCNYNCSFCVQKVKHKQVELPAKETIDFINRLSGNEVFLVGGEPMIRKDIVEIVNGINKKITIYSNGSFDKEVVKQFNKKVTFFCSYHQNPLLSVSEFYENMMFLKQTQNITHISAVSGTITNQEETKLRSLNRHGIQCGFGDNQWTSPQMRYMEAHAGKNVVCRFNRVLIGPDGFRYPCVAKLMNRFGGYSPFEPIKSLMSPCNMYGNCSACDVVVHKVQFT